MPRLIACALASALLVVAIAPAAPVPHHLMKPPTYYFPTKVGAKLEYEEPSRQLTMVVTAVAERGGAKLISVGRVGSDGTVSPLMTMCATGTGLYRTERNGEKLASPEPWLLLPAERDRCWQYPSSSNVFVMAPRPVARVTIEGTEEITVPAGTFRSIRVRHSENNRTSLCWYAPDVGLVKTEAATWVEVLKSYTPGRE